MRKESPQNRKLGSTASILFRVFLFFRPLNLLLLATTQILACVFLLKSDVSVSVFYLIFATFCSAAAGYVLNNIFDAQTDLLKHSKRAKLSKEYKNGWWITAAMLVFLSLYFAYHLSVNSFLSVLSSNLLLVFYAFFSKKLGFFKPFIVALLTGFSIIILGFEGQSFTLWLWIFSFWAFGLSILREVSKDLEDLESDVLQKSHTSATQLSLQKIILLLKSGSFVLMTSLLASLFLDTSFLSKVHQILMSAMLLRFVLMLQNHDYKKWSLWCKIMMIVGILGMVVY